MLEIGNARLLPQPYREVSMIDPNTSVCGLLLTDDATLHIDDDFLEGSLAMIIVDQ